MRKVGVGMITASTFVEIDGRHWTLVDGVYYVRSPWTGDGWTKPNFVPMAAVIMLSPVQRKLDYADNAGHIGTIGPGSDLTNDAFRRTEPAFVAPRQGVRRLPEVGMVTPWGTISRFDWCAAEVVLDGGAERLSFEYLKAWINGDLQWTPSEVERCKDHGVAGYACMAADCDQVRELLAVEEAKAEMEAWRLNNAEWLDWMTDSDGAGMLCEEAKHDHAEQLDHRDRWLRDLTPPQPFDGLGDWWARQEPGPLRTQTKEYMQYLFDKLSKGEVFG